MLSKIKIFDGAFGTYYFSKTGDSNPCETACITNPQIVLDIHREYIEAGANAIKTNTFCANRDYYDSSQLEEIISNAYSIAKQAVGTLPVEIFADIGNICTPPLDKCPPSSHYTEVANSFMTLGAHNFIFETLGELTVIEPALLHIKSTLSHSTTLVSFAVSQDGYSRQGIHYKTLSLEADANPHVDIIGFNCLCGPTHLLNLIKNLPPLKKPLSIMPNAGYPSTLNGRTVFRDNAEYFAEKLVELSKLGINILGGCCGTTPKHIRLATEALANRQTTSPPPIPSPPIPMDSSTASLPLKPLLVELDPPIDGNIPFLLNSARKLKACGVTALTLTDSPLAKVRADSILTAAKIRSTIDIAVIPHITCRDKNRLAIKSALLGAAFFDINSVLAITGDPICDADYKKSGVFDFNSQQLISYISTLNESVFADNPFSCGAALNVNALNFSHELKRALSKIQNGADFFLTQPIFTNAAIENFKRAREHLGCKLYAGILPIASYKNAIFLNNEVSGIDIPIHIVEQLKDQSADDVYNISIDFSRQIINALYDYAHGFYIMTPLKKTQLVCNLIKRCFNV